MRRKSTAIALSLSLALIPKPAQPNAAALVVPACSAFMPGCIVLGTVAIAGGLYWVYQNNQGLWVSPIIDPENPEGWQIGEQMVVFADNKSDAEDTCRRIARKYGKRFINAVPSGQLNGAKTYVCRFN
jgi:hypothetical protein